MGWIPLKTRQMTEEESEHYFEHIGERIDEGYEIIDCPMPEDGQTVLITIYCGVEVDTFVRDDEYGCYFEGVDIGDVKAWMPLPEPYDENKVIMHDVDGNEYIVNIPERSGE